MEVFTVLEEVLRRTGELVSLVPDVVWSGVIASLLTLGGVLLSNRSNTDRLRMQLQHDSDEKAKSRIADLRRDVYLVAAEELTKANAYLGALAQQDLVKTNVGEGLQGLLGAAAKLQLVAEPKTALLVNRLVSTYAVLLFKLVKGLSPLQRARTAISLSGTYYDKANAEADRIRAEMTKLKEAGQASGVVLDALNRSLDRAQREAEIHGDERSAAWDEFNRLNLAFTRELVAEMPAVSEQQLVVQLEIRRDLGLTAEFDAFRDQMGEQLRLMKSALDDLLQSLESDAGRTAGQT